MVDEDDPGRVAIRRQCAQLQEAARLLPPVVAQMNLIADDLAALLAASEIARGRAALLFRAGITCLWLAVLAGLYFAARP